jgi:hypothetical protein
MIKKWQEIHKNGVTSSVPPARGCCGFLPCITDHGLFLVIFGGMTIDGTKLTDLWALDVSTMTWVEIKTATTKFPQIFHYANVIQAGSLYVLGGATCKMGIFDINLYNDTYLFPIKEAIEAVTSNSTYPTWLCFHCTNVTTRTCQLCKKVPFCSVECEKQANEKHQEQCFLFGGREDPKKELERKIHQLEEDRKLKDIEVQKLAQEVQAMTNKEQDTKDQLIKERQRIQELNTQQEKLNDVIAQNEKLIAEKEQAQNSSKQINEKLAQEIDNLKSVKKMMEDKLRKQSKEVQSLELKAQNMEKQLQQTSTSAKLELEQLNAKLAEAKKAHAESTQALEEMLCQICMEKPKEFVLNCGHALCEQCSQSHVLATPKKECPFCCQKVTDRKKVFLY